MSDYIERYWRDATPADAIKEPPMVARFQDNDYGFWVIGELIYWDRSKVPWYREKYVGYESCQVYDAPDPGEGWRLIDTENEGPQEGDEFYDLTSRQWIKRSYPFASWVKSFNRRRIEPPKPKYVPFEWQDREQLRGRWIYQVGDENYQEMINKMDFGNNEFYANNKSARQLLNDWHFRDTGEPVGKRLCNERRSTFPNVVGSNFCDCHSFCVVGP